MASNPFYIEPANAFSPLQSLMQGYKQGKEIRTEESRKSALASLMAGGQAGGTPNYSAVANQLAQSGDLTGAAQVATIAKSLAGPETTDEIKEYNLAKGQGFKGSFFDFKTQLKQAGATRINNSVSTGENAYAKTVNEARAKDAIALQQAGRNAPAVLGTLNRMDALVDSPDFYSGPGAEKFALPLRQVVGALGGKADAAAPMEEFRALSSKAALDGMGGSLGTGFSNADRDFIVNQYPNLANTKEGNKMRIDGLRKVEQRKVEIARRARDYAKRNGGRIDEGFDEELSQWAEKNPLFKQQGGGTAAPKRLRFNPATGNLE